MDIRTEVNSNIHFKYALLMEELSATSPLKDEYLPKNEVEKWLFNVRMMELIQGLTGLVPVVIVSSNTNKEQITGDKYGIQNNN